MIQIDGAQGEGGGQVLRTSLALSMVTGQPFRIDNVRAGRPKPGLMRQHLTSVEAAAAVCGGDVAGAHLGSGSVEFSPGIIRGGTHEFSIGTAGSTTLVLQTVLPALITASEHSTLTISGGTHNMHAPSVHFLKEAFLPLINRMGPTVELELERHGFYPAGGGKIRIDIIPATRLRPFDLVETSPITSRRAIATVAGLPGSIAKREAQVLREKLGWAEEEVMLEQLDDGVGPGNIVSIKVAREDVTEVITGFGERGLSAEKVARGAASSVRRYLSADVPVWRHLADQLMLPLAMAGGGTYRTGKLTDHSVTNAAVIETFLPVKLHRIEDERHRVTVSVRA